MKSTAFPGCVPFDVKGVTALKQHLLPTGQKHPFSSVTLRMSPVAALDVLSQWLTPSGEENKQVNRATRKKRNKALEGKIKTTQGQAVMGRRNPATSSHVRGEESHADTV